VKTCIAVLCSAVLSTGTWIAAPPNGIVIHMSAPQGVYTWEISVERLYATPQWISEAGPIPVSFDKASESARAWLDKHGFKERNLLEARLCSWPDPMAVTIEHDKGKIRFYYQLIYNSELPNMSGMYVFVLMDGSIVEPTFAPAPARTKS